MMSSGVNLAFKTKTVLLKQFPTRLFDYDMSLVWTNAALKEPFQSTRRSLPFGFKILLSSSTKSFLFSIWKSKLAAITASTDSSRSFVPPIFSTSPQITSMLWNPSVAASFFNRSGNPLNVNGVNFSFAADRFRRRH